MVAPPWQRFGKTQYQSGNRAASHSIRPQQPRQRMFHPLIRMLATRPELLAQHLSGYAQLLGAQLGVAGGLLQDRALLLAGLLGGGLLGLGLAGVAGLLAAALPLAAMPAPWLLIALPALPLALAGVCAWALRRQPQVWSGALLREQMAADAALLHEVGAA